MIIVDVRFRAIRAPEIAFVKRGQVTLHDTCMVVSGLVLRYRVSMLNFVFTNNLSYSSYRTIPYGTIVKYFTRRELRTGFFRRKHIIDYRLPSGKKVRLSFNLLGGTMRSKSFQAALSDNLTATRSFYAR